MSEGSGLRPGDEPARSDVDPIGSNVDVSGIVQEQFTVDHQLVQRGRVDVQQHAPTAVDLNAVAGLRQHSVGPLTNVAPPPDKIFLDKRSGRLGTHEPAFDTVDLSVLK